MAVQLWRPLGRSLERWEPFRELGDVRAEMNSLFDAFFGRPVRVGATDRIWAPVADLHETEDKLVVSAELPGVKEKEIRVTITGDLLTIRGERSEERDVKEEQYHRVERFFGKFERNIALPIPVQSDKVKASYRDGVLEIHLPKAEEVKPKEIKIDVR